MTAAQQQTLFGYRRFFSLAPSSPNSNSYVSLLPRMISLDTTRCVLYEYLLCPSQIQVDGKTIETDAGQTYLEIHDVV
jgi:hypothetical protein